VAARAAVLKALLQCKYPTGAAATVAKSVTLQAMGEASVVFIEHAGEHHIGVTKL
jgi:hypothetical protein